MNWKQCITEHKEVIDEIHGPLKSEIEKTANLMVKTIRKGGKILICGNGGSAADAQHFAGELVGRFLKNRQPYPAIALTTDTSVITSLANDIDFDEIFSRQFQALAKKGDLLLAISTSGNSPNVLKAMEAAKKMKCKTIALTGGQGGAIAKETDISLNVRVSQHTPRIQEGHITIIHFLCEMVEEKLMKETA